MKLWTQREVGATGIPVESGGALYVPAGGNDVVALDASTGTVRWTATLDSLVLSGSLALAGTFVYAETDAGVTAIDRDTGEIRWNVGAQSLFPGPPVAGGDMYVTGNAGHLLDVDRKSGRITWDSPVSPNSVPAVADGSVFVTTGPLHLVAFDAATGALEWDVRPRDPGIQAADPVVADGLVFVAADADQGMYAFDPLTGAVAWHLSEPVGFGPPVAADGLLFEVDGAVLNAIDDLTGKVKWKTSLPDKPETRLLAANGVLYYGFDGGIGLVDANSGEFLRSLRLRGRWGFRTMPIVADGVVFAITQFPHRHLSFVYAFGLPSGR